MTLPPRRLNLISFFGECALAVVGARLGWSFFHRGDLFMAAVMVTLSAVAGVLAVRYLREYRRQAR